ncbi:Calcium/calmodulin-dependent protein kinase-like [Penicillium camemberti]|uniref:Calcium/calmodulin-dependent protein kinase-like n=1 Tax=Penicillium camemberti (strain FM 013) TaxID=1429867 RepID=A0A0G4NZL5_PENC3|nr:Calcium/calmodulin-dependent protein kinase-like [Penicillium camemberti]
MAFDGISSNELPDYDIVEFSCGSFDGTAELTIRCYGKQFHIQVSAKNLDDGSEFKCNFQRLLRRLDDPTYPEGDGDTDPMEDLCFWIAYNCNSEMRDLASPCLSQLHTLKDWLILETVILTMTMKDGQVATIASPPDPSLLANLIHQMELPFSFQSLNIPTLDPSTITLRVGPEQTRPTEVSFGSDRFFFKATCSYSHAIREISTLLRLKGLGLIQVVHSPILHGFVLSPDDSNKICGYLLEYIEHRDILSGVEVKDEPLSVRTEWIRQLGDMIGALHKADIIWGDAKPDNVLVDKDNNLRLIDFGGGHTYGWVDEDKAETVEGDKQALLRMTAFLTTGERPN